jgi:hypothetical protein
MVFVGNAAYFVVKCLETVPFTIGMLRRPYNPSKMPTDATRSALAAMNPRLLSTLTISE